MDAKVYFKETINNKNIQIQGTKMNINEAKKRAENSRRMSEILAKLSSAPNKNAKKRAAAELSRIGIESALKLAPVSEAEELFNDFDVLSENEFAMKYSGVLGVPIYEGLVDIAKNHMKTRGQIDALKSILNGEKKPKAPKTEVFPGSSDPYKRGIKTIKTPKQVAKEDYELDEYYINTDESNPHDKRKVTVPTTKRKISDITPDEIKRHIYGREINHRIGVHRDTETYMHKEDYELNEGAGDLSDEARELTLHADNDRHLHMSSHEPIMTNLRKKVKEGKYDSALAKKLWRYHADRAAQDYAKKHGNGIHWSKMFTPAHRDEAAAHWEEMHRGELSEAKNPFTQMDVPGTIASRVSTRVISDPKARKKAARDANKPPKVDKKGKVKNPTPNVLNPPAVTRVARPKTKAPGVVRGITVPIKKIAGEMLGDVVGAIKNRNQPYERLQEEPEMTKMTPDSMSKRNLNVERDIMEIMSQDRDVRMEAKLAEAKLAGIISESSPTHDEKTKYAHPGLNHEPEEEGGPDLSKPAAGHEYHKKHGLVHPGLPMHHGGWSKSTGVYNTGHHFLSGEHIHDWHKHLMNTSPDEHEAHLSHLSDVGAGRKGWRGVHLATVNAQSILAHHYTNLLVDHKKHLANAKTKEEKDEVHARLARAHDAAMHGGVDITGHDGVHRYAQHILNSRKDAESIIGKSKD